MSKTSQGLEADLSIAVGTKVRFRESALARMEPKLRKRLTNRVGKVTSCREGAEGSLVHFPPIGMFYQFLLCDVDVAKLDLLNE